MLKPEVKPRPHQESAAETALKRDGNIIFSHPVGSGKTLTSIYTFEKLKANGRASRALVVTPASLRVNYGENGVKKFTNSRYRIYGNKQEISSDKTGTYSEPTKEGPEYGIVSYELFRENPEKYIKEHGADTVIFDEVHRIKNDQSKTFTALKASRPLFKNFIGMTGSIASNTPADVVPLIDAMTNGDHKLGSKTSFDNRFVNQDKDGNKVLVNSLVVRALIAPYVHNVTEEQVNGGTGLAPPKKIVKEVPVELTQEHADYYRYVINQLDPLTKLKLQYGMGKLSDANMNAIFAKLLRSRQAVNGVHTVNKDLTLEESAAKSTKVKRMLDDVEDHLKNTSDGQVVIHSELLQGGLDVVEAGLKQRGLEYGKFIGKGNAGVTEKARQQDVDDYNAGKKKILLISSAGGEGLDLPNTTMVASLDGHYNPEKVNQVEARGIRLGGLSHRPESERKVLVNRYVGVLPLAKTEVAHGIYSNVSPDAIFNRAINGGPLFYNPFKRLKTVDQAMYEVAAQKAKGNDQLKGLFEKTSKFEPISDKEIMGDYLHQYQDKLLSGDYKDGYIDEIGENRYINRLRDYYGKAKLGNTKNVNVKEYDKIKKDGQTLSTLKAIKPVALGLGFLGAAGAMGPTFHYHTMKRMYEISGKPFDREHHMKQLKMGLAKSLIVPGLLGGLSAYGAFKHYNNPIVTTPKATAKKLEKMTDPELLKMLRGEAITKEEIKKKDHFIKVK